MVYVYKTKGVCSREMTVDVDENGIIQSCVIKGGCPGNLVEVMTCVGGCVGGAGVVMPAAKGAKAVENFATKGKV